MKAQRLPFELDESPPRARWMQAIGTVRLRMRIEMLASNPSMGFVKLIASDATYDARGLARYPARTVSHKTLSNLVP